MKTTILSAITEHGPIKQKDLHDLMNHYARRNEVKPISKRRMRHFIKELLDEGHPIASSCIGYSIINSLSEAMTAKNYMSKPLKARALRANQILHNFNARQYQSGKVNEQIKLF